MCLRFWKLRAGGANKKRKIYYCRTMNSNVEVIGDMEPETALVFSIVVCVIDKTGFKATYSKQFSII